MTAEGLAKYTPRRKPAHVDNPQDLDWVRELLAQAEALRGDFPLREAKLRQAADIFDDAAARADEMSRRLDEVRRGGERAAGSAAQATAAARELLAGIEKRHADLLGASQSAQDARSAAQEAAQEHHRFQSEVDAARLDLAAFLEDVRIGREEVQSLKSAPSSFAPGELPGDFPAPGIGATPPLYPAGPTVLGYVLPLISANAITDGITLTSGPALTFTATPAVHSGAFGLFLDKPDKTDTSHAHSLVYEVGGAPLWEWGVDFNTNNSINGGTGGSYLSMFDHTANGNLGADIFIFSPAEQDSISTGVKATKLSFCGTGTGSAKDFTDLATFNVGSAVDLGGLSLTIKSQNARDHITLVNAHATSKRAVIKYAALWFTGTDMAGSGDTGFTWRDATHSLNRLYIENTAAISAKVGINTTGPVGGLHYATSNDASLYDTVQTGLAVGFSTIANRTWLVQQILDASQTENFCFMMGGLGAGSTRATPVTTSTSTPAFGIKANQTQMDLIAAPSGTNQTIVKGVSVSQTGGAATVGLYGVPPVIRAASNEDLRTSLINLGAITGGVNPLNTNGGALTVGAVAASGAHGGSGTAFQFARLAFTFAADANETLDATNKAFVIIDIQTGVLGAQRDLLVSGNAGAFYIIINREAFAVNVRVGANTGIVVGSHKSRILCFPGGTNCFSLTPDVDYTA